MSKMLWVVAIVLFVLFMKFQYPEMYDTGREKAVDVAGDVIDDFTNQSGKIIGKPYTEFDCFNDSNCLMYDNAFCNITSGECHFV